MGIIKTLAVLGGTGLAINELAKTQNQNRSANVQVKTNLDALAVKEAIAKDPNLLQLVRGEKGEQGIQGIQGQVGISINTNNIIGQFEFMTNQGIYDVPANYSNFHNYDLSKLRKDRLYRLNIELKGESIGFNLRNLSGEGVLFSGWKTGNTIYHKIDMYVNLNIVSTLDLLNSSQNIGFYRNFYFEEVSLGEAVPHNLPYLPEGQTVFDNTRGKVGRYNGTNIDWYM